MLGQCFISGFEATADLLAVSFNEGVLSARIFDAIEVFPNTNESVGLFLGGLSLL